MSIDRLLDTLRLRLRSVFRRGSAERELDEELQYHLERQVAEHVARGMHPDDARTAALRALGGVERRKDEMRDQRKLNLAEDLLRDARYALRTLRRTPGFTATAILTLALGIGANTAIFTVVNAVLLRPLPYESADRLVIVQYRRGETVAPGVFLDWKESSRSFERLAASEYWTPNWTGSDRATELAAVRIGADLLPMLGVQPMLGRWFHANEEHGGQHRAVILANELWRSRFAGDSAVIGRTMTLSGEPYVIVGVMPPGFAPVAFFASGAQLYAPLVLDARRNDRSGSSMRVFAKLAPGVTLERARAELTAIAAGLEQQHPGTNQHVTAIPLHEKTTGGVRDPLLILLAAVGFVLLITCANVAHLQLMRAATREREFALRTALGGSRPRLFQQSLVESLILALAGGVLGLLLAAGGLRVLVALAPPGLPRIDTIGLDGTALAIALLVSMAAAVAFGMAPALAASRVDLHATLQEGGRGGHDGRRRGRMRALLVVSEFAMALVLLIGAGLVIRSFAALTGVHPGFDAARTLTLRVSVRGTAADERQRRHAFFGEAIERIRALPGVADASAINHVPLLGDDWHFPFAIEGQAPPQPGAEHRAQFLVARAGYFRTMGIALSAGREFTPQDEAASAQLVIINEVLAERFWPGESPLGRRLTVDDAVKQQHPNWFTVSGVVREVRQGSLAAEVEPQLYFPSFTGGSYPWANQSLISFLSPASMTLVVRASGDPAAVLPSVRAAVAELAKDAPVSDAMTMEQALGTWLTAPRFYLFLLGTFAGLAVLLAAVGVYGVISYSVARRTHEIGVRLALGARRGEAFALVVRQGMGLAVAGTLAGLAVAVATTRYLRALLYGVQPGDPVTFVVVAVVLVLVALLACCIPARRASRVDPMTALRCD